MKNWIAEWRRDLSHSGRNNKATRDYIKQLSPTKKTKKKIDFSSNKYIPYSEQIKRPEWLRYRTRVISMRNNQCEICGSMENLQVHHIEYLNDKRYAWQYPFKSVMVLCRDCHAHYHGIVHDKRLADLLEDDSQ